MSCCGESKSAADKNPQQQQQQGQFNQWNPNAGPVTQQPGTHPQPSFGGYQNQPGGFQANVNPSGYPSASMNGYPQQPPTAVHHQPQVSSGGGQWGASPDGTFGMQQPTDAYGNPVPSPPVSRQGQGSGEYCLIIVPLTRANVCVFSRNVHSAPGS
jgi:hypothetical protein